MNIARFDSKTPCYICGRTTGGKCGIDRDTNLLYCWTVGDTFAPPAVAVAKKGRVTKGRNGLDYAFVGLAGASEEWATFKVHEEIEKVSREWVYRHVEGGPCVIVHRIDQNGSKKMWQAPTGGFAKVPPRAEIAPYGRFGDDYTLVVEGESTADAALRAGLPAICLIGGSGGDPRSLEVAEGQVFVLCPDRDAVGLEFMQKVAIHVTGAGGVVRWLYANPTSERWEAPSDGYDLADWLSAGADAEMVLAAVVDAPRVAEPATGGFWDRLPVQEKMARMEAHDLQSLLMACSGDTLRWNRLTNTLEIDGQAVSDIRLNTTYIAFSSRNIRVSREDALHQLLRAAQENSYHPVHLYLESCNDPLPDELWDNLAGELLGSHATDIDNSLLRKWLVSAVARVYEPGQRADFLYVLAGAGATHKTRFFGTLVGWQWFQEGFQDDIKQKDALMKCHRYWVTEMGEVDGMTSKKAAAEVKNFITTKCDALRAPYGKAVEMFPRQFVLCATTNQTDGFLVDDTGNRRFAMFRVDDPIDVERVEGLRDRIWASAVRDYKRGLDWNMSREELGINEEKNEAWMLRDPWQTKIGSYLAAFQPDLLLSSDILTNVLEMPLKDQHTGHLTRVARCLTSLGWMRQRRRLDGRMLTVWLRKV